MCVALEVQNIWCQIPWIGSSRQCGPPDVRARDCTWTSGRAAEALPLWCPSSHYPTHGAWRETCKHTCVPGLLLETDCIFYSCPHVVLCFLFCNCCFPRRERQLRSLPLMSLCDSLDRTKRTDTSSLPNIKSQWRLQICTASREI